MSEKVETVPGVIVGGLGIVRRVVLSNKEDITFQVALDSTADKSDVFALLDTITAAAEREGWKADLAQKEQAYRIAQVQPAELDKEIRRLTDERARQDASLHAAHAISNKRGDFKPTAQQQGALGQYEAQIAAAQASKANFKNDLPIIEYEIACLKAKIAGEPEPEKPEAVERAQMGAVVAFSDAAD